MFSPVYGFTFSALLFLSLFVKTYLNYFLQGATNNNFSFQDIISNLSSSFFSDLLVRILSVFFVILAVATTKSRIRKTSVIIIILFFLLFAIEILTLSYAWLTLSIPEIYQMIFSGSSGAGNIICILLIEIVCYFSIWCIIAFMIRNIEKRNLNLINIIFLILWTTLFLSIGIAKKLEKADLSNIFTLNFSSFFYNSSINQDEKKDYTSYFSPIKWSNKRPNIIFIFSESLSAIDSKKAGWNDNLPSFDKISEKGIFFPHIIANGGTSDTAHISVLLWVEPLFRGNTNSIYSWYIYPTSPLAKYFDTLGYSTTFVSAAPLTFLEQRKFIEEVWFKNIIGEEAFEDKKKYVFSAAPDGDLYDKIIETIQKENESNKPFFIGAQTISFHEPRESPYGEDMAKALKYADDSLETFYERLEEIWYFNSGILIILWDHRKRTPIEENEIEVFGKSAKYNSLWMIIGTGITPKIDERYIQPTDFFYSLKQYTAQGEVLIKDLYNNIFSDYQWRDWALITSYYSEVNKYLSYSYEWTGIQEYINISELALNRPDIYEYLASYSNYELNTNETVTTWVILIGHRGDKENSAENSLEWFFNTKKHNLKGIEFDVSLTKDGYNIVHHGEQLWHTTCKNTYIKDHSFDRIRKNCKLENGETIKTLDEMLSLINGLFQYYFLEIKGIWDNKEVEKQTLDAIETVKKNGMEDKVIFISYHDQARETLLNATGIILWRDTYDTKDFFNIELLENENIKYFLTNYQNINQKIIDIAKRFNKELAVYTVNETSDLQQVINSGVNIIMTDKIETMNDYIATKEKQP